MGKKKRPCVQCLLLYVEERHCQDEGVRAPPSASSAPPRVTKAYAVLPQGLLARRPALIRMLKANNIQPLNQETVASLSPDDVEQLKLVEIRLRGDADAPVEPLEVGCPSNCGPLVKRLFPRTTTQVRDITRNCAEVAIDDSNLKIFEQLLSRSVEIPCAFGARFRGSLLHWAVSLSSHSWKIVMEMLLEKGADVNSRDSQNNTPLFLAVRTNNIGMVKLLLKNGASAAVLCGDETEGEGTSVLEEAYYQDHEPNQQVHSDIFEYLLARCFVHPQYLEKSKLQKLLVQVERERFSQDPGSQECGTRSAWRSRTLARHLVKVLAFNNLERFPFLDDRAVSVIHKLAGPGFKMECVVELAQMKRERFSRTSGSIYDFLRQNSDGVARLIETKSVVALGQRTLKFFKRRLPAYWSILARHLEKGQDRLWLRNNLVFGNELSLVSSPPLSENSLDVKKELAVENGLQKVEPTLVKKEVLSPERGCKRPSSRVQSNLLTKRPRLITPLQ